MRIFGFAGRHCKIARIILNPHSPIRTPTSNRAWLWAVPPPHYAAFLKTGTFAIRKNGRAALQQMRAGDVIFVYLSGSKVIAGMVEAIGEAFHDATPLVAGGHYPWRLRVRPIVALSEEDRVPYDAFHDRLDVVSGYPDFGAVARQVIHPLPTVDAKVLEFLVRARQAADFETILAAYHAYQLAQQGAPEPDQPSVAEPPSPYAPARPFDRAEGVEGLIDYIDGRGFVYEPWQVAAYATALRTKPFVILAGVTGTGKSKLPALVAAGTGGLSQLVPVRPDWTDSADVLGYLDLAGRFRPGAVLRAARAAQEHPQRHITTVLDEMNLARVEHYFAEILSRIEDRAPAPGGGYASAPLVEIDLPAEAAVWRDVPLPPNLALVGTVNMDESAHGFSRKVLDRAFTLELAEVDLTVWATAPGEPPEPARWPVEAWFPRALALAGLVDTTGDERTSLRRTVETLDAVNRLLAAAQVQVAYRTRDEIALFLLHAAATPEAFRTRGGTAVDPLDLALHMKLLPRLAGGSPALRHALVGLLGWATTGAAFRDETDARTVLDAWEAAGRLNALPDARYPRTAARLALMTERLLAEGFTAYWL